MAYLPNINFPRDTFSNAESMSPDEFWDKILNFPELYTKPFIKTKFVLEVLSLPHAITSEIFFS